MILTQSLGRTFTESFRLKSLSKKQSGYLLSRALKTRTVDVNPWGRSAVCMLNQIENISPACNWTNHRRCYAYSIGWSLSQKRLE